MSSDSVTIPWSGLYIAWTSESRGLQLLVALTAAALCAFPLPMRCRPRPSDCTRLRRLTLGPDLSLSLWQWESTRANVVVSVISRAQVVPHAHFLCSLPISLLTIDACARTFMVEV